MKNYWVSWVQRTDDHRPLGYPPNESVLGWWCTGYDSDDNAILCALVRAESPEMARTCLLLEWPEIRDVLSSGEGWRFFKHDVSLELSDRFPLSDWMQERIDAVTVEQPDRAGGEG